MPRRANPKPLPLLIAFAFAFLATAAASPQESPRELFLAQLQKFQPTTLQSHFTCEKFLAGVDASLSASGDLFASRDAANSLLHIRTTAPYASDNILKEGKLFARSQHESKWSAWPQSGKSGMSIVTVLLGNLLLGRPAQSDSFDITTPSRNMFVLTPATPDLSRNLKSLTLTFDPASNQLTTAEILTTQNDLTRYKFSNLTVDKPLPAEAFRTE